MKHDAIKGFRLDLKCFRDELADLERYTPEQIEEMFNQAIPKIDYDKSFKELFLFGTTSIKIDKDGKV